MQKFPFVRFSCISLPWHCLKYKVSDSAVLSCCTDLNKVTGSVPLQSMRATLWFFSREAQRIPPCFLQLWKAQDSPYIQWFSMHMQGISLFFILVWETICFQISHDGILWWSGCSNTQSFKREDQCSLFCSCSGIIIFISAGTSRRIAEYELRAYLFYKTLLPPWDKHLPRLSLIFQGKNKIFWWKYSTFKRRID